MTINVLAVRADATPVSTQASSWGAAALEALRWLDDPFYHRPYAPVVRVFAADPERERREEWTPDALRAARRRAEDTRHRGSGKSVETLLGWTLGPEKERSES